jgi:hypothetical protein
LASSSSNQPPVKNQDGNFEGNASNMFSRKGTPDFIKIDAKEVGSCYAIQDYNKLPAAHHPKISLKANVLKGTEWENAIKDIALCVIPNLAPLPFGKTISSINFDDSFINKMDTISKSHDFWEKLINDVIEQAETESNVRTIAKWLIDASEM